MSGNDNRYLLDTLPFGIGYVKLIQNPQKESHDYIVLELNSALEALTGLRRRDVQGKRLSDIFSARQSRLNWERYLSYVLRSKKIQQTTRWIDLFSRRLHVTVIPTEDEILALVIRKAADEPPMPWMVEDPLVHVFGKQMEMALDHAHDAVSPVEHRDGEFFYLLSNVSHQALTGFSDIGGCTPVELLGEEAGGVLLGYYRQCISTGQPVTYKQKFQFALGERLWQTQGTPVFQKGEVTHLLCASKDVSELKGVQGEKEGLARRLHAIFHQHSAIMLVFDPDSGRIFDANPAACQFYGYSQAEFHSIRIRDINMLPLKEFQESCQKALRDKDALSVVPHRLKSGEIRLVDTYFCPFHNGEKQLLYSIVFDVTDRENYRNELIRQKETLRITLGSIGDGVVITDHDGIITSINTLAQNMTGWEEEDAIGKHFTEVFWLQNEETGEPVQSPIEKVLATGRTVGLANHTMLLNRRGQLIPIADSAAPIKGEDGTSSGVVMVFRDVSMEKEHSRQVGYLSYHDLLTGLYNRRYIVDSLGRLDTAQNLPLSVIMGDVNGLKITNDAFGHQAADALLQQVACLLKNSCRPDDMVARWGGDEFIILLPQTTQQEAEAIIEGIKSRYTKANDSGLQISVSLGCAVKEREESNIRAVMREAEENMYHQKLLDGKSYRNAIINTLLATLYEKSIETQEHSKRMEFYCHAIGKKLELSSKDLDDLSLLAILHDIGKVGVSPDIIKKSGPLTPEEWVEMKKHPEIGYRIAQATPELSNVAEFILSHHERWDGTGYPRGLKGEEIPLICRILSVTDAYDAMTNDRAYRSAMSHQQAVGELKKHAGTQFDPAIASVFIQVLEGEGSLCTHV